MANVTVRIPTPLRGFTGGADSVAAQGATVGEAIRALCQGHQGLGERILDGTGELRSFVNLYLGSDNVRELQGLETRVEEGAVLSIVPAVAGGLR